MSKRKLIIEVAVDPTKMTRGFKQAQTASTKFTASVERGFSGLARGIGIGTIGLAGFALGARNAISASSTFQDSLQKIVGLSGVAQEKIAGMTAAVLQLAPEVGKGPQELAEALYFITSSGIDASRALDVLKVSAKASAAGLGETQVVADAVTSAINAYGAETLSAQQATDVLVATVREGKGEAAQFAGVIGNVAALAAQLGVSFEDVGAALAAETRLGVDAETASIQLQQVFSNLVKVSPAAEKAFRRVGLSSKDLRKELAEKGLLETLQTIKAAFGNDLPALSAAFPNIRALRGLLALVGNQADEVSSVFGKLRASSGSLNSAFGAISKDQAQGFRRFNAALDVTKITLGSALAPAAEKAATALSAWLSQSKNQQRIQRDLESAVRLVTDAFNGLKAVVEPVVDALGGVRNAVKLLAVLAVSAKILALADSIGLIGTRAKTSKLEVMALRTQLKLLGAIGAITIPLEIITSQSKGTSARNAATAGTGLGAVTGFAIVGPLGAAVGAVLGAYLGSEFGKALDEVNPKIIEQKALAKLATLGVPKKGQDIWRGAFLRAIYEDNSLAESLAIADKALTDAALTQPSAVTDKKTPTTPTNSTTKTPSATTGKGISADQRNQWFDSRITRQINRVQDIATIGGQIKALNKISALIQQRIAATKDVTRRLNLEDQLLEVQRQTKTLTQQRTDTKQFAALGFSPTGGEITPGVKALRRQLGSISTAVEGTFLDTKKTRSLLSRIRKVLGGGLGQLSEEVRAKVRELLNGLNDELKNNQSGPLTKTTALNTDRILAGLGLGPQAERALRARLSRFNSAGVALTGSGSGAMVQVQSTVVLDGRVVAKSTTKHQQKGRKRNPPPRRGPNAGIPVY